MRLASVLRQPSLTRLILLGCWLQTCSTPSLGRWATPRKAALQAADAFGSVVITGTTGTVIALLFDAVVAAGFAGLGLAARKAASWAFIVGMSIYGLDALLLAWATDWLSVAFHGLALFFLYNGLRASRQLAAARAAALIPPGIAPPLTP